MALSRISPVCRLEIAIAMRRQSPIVDESERVHSVTAVPLVGEYGGVDFFQTGEFLVNLSVSVP